VLRVLCHVILRPWRDVPGKRPSDRRYLRWPD